MTTPDAVGLQEVRCENQELRASFLAVLDTSYKLPAQLTIEHTCHGHHTMTVHLEWPGLCKSQLCQDIMPLSVQLSLCSGLLQVNANYWLMETALLGDCNNKSFLLAPAIWVSNWRLSIWWRERDAAG